MGTQRWWIVAIVLLVGAVVAAVLLWGGDEDVTVESEGTTTTSTTAVETTTTTTTTSTTAPSTTSTARPTTTTPGPPPPGPVTGVAARTGGGSGEVEVEWNAVAGATGYRVLRAASSAGPFELTADVDVVTGAASVEPGVVNIFSDGHTYVPPGGTLTQPDGSARFHYVDLGNGARCYQVRAINAGGEGPASVVACGSPP